jgi:lipopolysaccharide assembly protein B
MEFEYWWLIGFPVFFGLGWIAARIDLKHLISESRALPRSYFKGLNFLLNEQPDQAIEAFIEVVKVEPETIDLHFALGSLFRRRGETDRAIRMHRNLLERTDLAPEQRLHALVELGEDYMKAGLLDRAEESYSQLRSGPYRARALKSLLDIYQVEKDWRKAIKIAEESAQDSGQSWAKEIANYWCEIAIAEMNKPDAVTARAALTEALLANKRCVRANLIAGDLAVREGNHAAAIDAWRSIEQQDANFLALVAQRLLASFRALGRNAEGLALLKEFLEKAPSLDMLDVAFQSTLDAEGPEAAYRLVRDELRRNPTLLGLDRLLEAQLISASAERRQELELVKNLVHGQTRRLSRYRCVNCGFKARQFYWQCPACSGWETYPPRRTEEFELGP